MDQAVQLVEKYERNGWPSVARPDCQPPTGWSLALINSLNHIHHYQLSPDGEKVAFVWERDGRSDIFVMTTAPGSWPQRLTPDRDKTVYWLDSAPQWSPNGRWLAFTYQGHVHVVPSDGSSLPHNVSDFSKSGWGPVWLPDSERLIISTARHETSSLLLTDRHGSWPRPLTHGQDGDDFEAQVAPNGRYVAYVHRPSSDLNRLDLRLVDVETGLSQTLVGVAKQKSWHPRWSPNGQQIAFLAQRSGYSEIWLIRADGSGLRQLTNLQLEVGELAWSPDGLRLAITLNRDGAMDLVLLDVATGELRDLCVGLGVYANICWVGNGRWLTVEYETPTTPPDIYRVEVSNGRCTQLTFSNLPTLAAHTLIMPQRVRYTSTDGLEIPALLFRPPQPNGAAIVRPHGGPTDQYKFEYDSLAQYFLAKGYTWLMPNFRGSTGYGVAFEHGNYSDWGLGDTQDVLSGARFLRTCDWIHPNRIAIFGSSYGGYMVACCLANDPDYLFACGVSKYGDAHLYSSWAQCERDTRLYTEMQIGHPRSHWAVYQAGSPIWNVANIRKPVLLVHGLLDDIVPPQASEEWVEALRRHDKVFEYKTYAGEPHGFLKYKTEMDWQSRLERFLDWYLVA